MRSSMPTVPTLMRTSAPSAVELALSAIAEHARSLTVRELADCLGCSPATAVRRRRGFGWKLRDVPALARAVGKQCHEVLVAP